jgi:hypothetical protein
MHAFVDPYWWTFALAMLVQFILFARWLYRRIRDDELNRAFIRDMATNHLPHIYELLNKICEKQGIEYSRPSRIRWVDFTTHRR